MSDRLDTIIKNGLVVLRGGTRKLDIGIRDGLIAQLTDRLESEASRVIDAEGHYVLPGLVDAHVHLNEPGMGHWEGFATGSAALAAGGITTYIDMPLNGTPPTVSLSALQQKLDAAKEHSHVDYAIWGGLVPGNRDQLEGLAEAGVVGFKAFLSAPGGEGEDIFREVDDLTLYEGMKRIAALNGVLALHAESDSLTSRLAERARSAGKTSALDYAATRPVLAELEAVNRALFYARHTGCALHFVHISSEAAIELIDRAKQVGMNVTSETCPHYLAFTEEDMERLGAVAKCAPPLRSESEQEKLWRAVEQGRVDVIASDHSPCPAWMKSPESGSFFDAWGGISGAQNTLEVMLHEAHVLRGIPLEKLAEMLSYLPAKRFGLDYRKGEIRIGADADIVLVDPKADYTLEAAQLYSRHKHSPYTGRTFSCRVAVTLCRGQEIYNSKDGVVGPLGFGQWVLSSSAGAGAAAQSAAAVE